MASAVQAMTGLQRSFALYACPEFWPVLSSGKLDLSELFGAYETVWVQTDVRRLGSAATKFEFLEWPRYKALFEELRAA